MTSTFAVEVVTRRIRQYGDEKGMLVREYEFRPVMADPASTTLK